MVRKITTTVTGEKPRDSKKAKTLSDASEIKVTPAKANIKKKTINFQKRQPRLGRTRRCLKQWMNCLNTTSAFYDDNERNETQLYLPIACGVRKISKKFLIDFNLLIQRLAKSYVSRACVLAHVVKQCNAVTPQHLETVDTFFC